MTSDPEREKFAQADAQAAYRALTDLINLHPTAVRAIRIFGEHVLKGQNVKEALVKTGEILAAEALI